ncbi:NADPH-dependent F420 reductase [Streptomyces sp. NRRL F-2747]|uniref:NADPH-dependent F420 reductase n=1 Tax=Streptomyces sp. NRRL F-2747 TaxID=1463843 RepID=UPI00068A45B0|nr:NAD(P)-binding domain-containing protein [Streptomyces sp. NRRL F-2747]
MTDDTYGSVCVLGAGRFGTALALRLMDRGVSTRVATRRAGAETTGRSGLLLDRRAVRPTLEALDGADIVVLALPFAAALNLAEKFPGFAEGRIVVDATNPLTEEGDGIVLPPDTSGAVEIARRIPYARLVKAFSTCTTEDLTTDGAGALNLVAGDDERAKRTVLRLSRHLGLAALDAGVLAHCGVLEGMALLREEIRRRNPAAATSRSLTGALLSPGTGAEFPC